MNDIMKGCQSSKLLISKKKQFRKSLAEIKLQNAALEVEFQFHIYLATFLVVTSLHIQRFSKGSVLVHQNYSLHFLCHP